MPHKKRQFVNGEIYHVVLRGLDNNLIFKDIDDYYRGIFSIYEFNNAKPVEILKRRQEIQTAKKKIKASGGRTSLTLDGREKFVEVFSFCLMPNHIHLLLRQLKDGGLTKFMRKFGSGYGGYFNRKYNRMGYVFQNRFSAIHIKNEEQLRTVFVYIHTNPIAIIEPCWKEKGIKDEKKAIEFLENYKWSSYPDYIGKKNFPSVTERKSILEIMNRQEGCKEFVEAWIKYKRGIGEFPKLSLE